MARKKESGMNSKFHTDMIDMYTKMSSEMSKKSNEEKMKFLQKMSIQFRKDGSIQEAKDLQNFVKEDWKVEREANEEMEQLIGAAVFQKMQGIPEEHRTGDGDQTPVYGHFEIAKLKTMWASGMNWNPSNPFNSPWLLVLAAGDYDEMMKIIDKTPKQELKDLLEKRETLCNFSAIFHIVKGANNLERNQKSSKISPHFFDYFKTPRHIDCLKKIIELGGNVNARDFAGFTPLFYCVTCFGNTTTLELAKILLENGADINAQNRFGETALCQPMLTRELEFIRLLLDYGIDPSIKDNSGMAAVNMNVLDRDCNILFAEARKKKAKKMREEAKKDEGGVLSCEACKKPSIRRCTGCYVARYCSKECQVSHWKSHKKACRENKDLFVPVKFEFNDKTFSNIAWNKGGEVSMINPGKNRPKTIFTIKIQVPRSLAPVDIRSMKMKPCSESLTVYDKGKDVYGFISSDDASYFKLRKLVETKGLDGLTGYFDAIFDKDGILKININNLKIPKDW